MRVLFLSNYYPPCHKSGYEELCEEAAKGLKNKGHQVLVLTSNEGQRGNENGDIQIKRQLQLEVSGPPILVSIKTVIKLKSRMALNIERVKETLDNFQPNIIMVWGMWNIAKSIPAFIEEYSNVPVVYFFADYWPLLPNSIAQHWQNQSLRRATNLPKQILGAMILKSGLYDKYDAVKIEFSDSICVSQFVKNFLVESRIIPSSSVVIHSGIHVDAFLHEARTNNKILKEPRKLTLLYAGRISRDKGISTAIEAVKILNEKGIPVELNIFGDGDPRYLMELLSFTKKWGLEGVIHFFSRVERKEMSKIYSSHDIILVPSIMPDPLPRVVIEGMCSGCIVIATRVGGIPEMIEHGVNGLLFEPEDEKELSDLIQELFNHPSTHESILSAGRNTVKSRFDIDRFEDDIEEYLLEKLHR